MRMYSTTRDAGAGWLVGAVKNNPEGLLLLAAGFALSQTGVFFPRHPVAYVLFFNAGPERDDCAHVFMTRREIFIEWQAALN